MWRRSSVLGSGASSARIASSSASSSGIRDSGVNGTFVYDIFKGKSMPGRDNALMLAFGLHCDERETQRLLRLAGVSELWPKRRRDAIILWCVKHGLTRVACDEELFCLGERTLFDPEDEGE